MAKKVNPAIDVPPQPEDQKPEVKLVSVEEQAVPVSLVEEKTEEMLAPVKLVEEVPALVKVVEEPLARPAEAPLVLPVEAPEPAAAAQKTPAPGILNWLFDPSTARGRSMRTFSRWAAVVIGFFALGFLVAYFALYRPVMQQLEASRAEAAALTQQVDTLQGKFNAADGELKNTKNLLLQAQNGQAETQDSLKQLDTKHKVLEILYDVTAARLAWMTNDRVVALAFLVNAGEMLGQIRPEILAKDSKLPDFINEQLTGSLSDLKNNAPSAPNGLEKLHRTVQSLERLFEVLSQ